MKTKIITTAIIVTFIVACCGLLLPVVKVSAPTAGVIAGATNSTARIASCVLDLSTTTPTTATTTLTGCLFNGDGADRVVTNIQFQFYGLTTTNSNGNIIGTSTLVMSTSTAQYATSSANYLINQALGTTTALAPAGQLYIATTSPGISGTTAAGGLVGTNDFVRIWKTGTYLNLSQTASTTAQGIIIVNYFSSSQ